MKKIFWGIRLCMLLLPLNILGQFIFPTCGGRNSAMGGSSVALTDFWSGIENIAGLSNVKKITIGLSFANRFSTSELNYKNVAIVIPTSKSNALGLRYIHFGNRQYNEQLIALEYAQALGKHLSIGIELDYLHSACADTYYNTYNNLTFGIGIQFYISQSFTVGTYIFNPFYTSLNQSYNINIPALIRVGLMYEIASDFISTLDFEKNILFDNCLRIGLEYKFFSFLYARIGFSTEPTLYTLGVGLKYNKWELDIATQIHSLLGISPNISVTYYF